MVDLAVQRVVFDATSRLTNHFPRAGARLLDATFKPAFGSSTVGRYLVRKNRRTVNSIQSFERLAVVSDIHIGDAMFAQSAVTALRDFFPDARIDFIVNHAAAAIVDGLPDATNVLPIFPGGSMPTVADDARLADLVRRERYDLCVSFSPFIPDSALSAPGVAVLKFMSHSPQIVSIERSGSGISHFAYQGYRFVSDLLSTVAAPVRPVQYKGFRTVHRDEAIEQAGRFASQCGIGNGSRVIGYNPDAACRFTTMPFDLQSALLRRLANVDATILVGAGHTQTGVGQRLADSLPAASRSRVRIVPPDMPLDAYSALIDFCDVFITGDTGPLHLAAARRYSRNGSQPFRNRTAVMSVFGATTPRMSGYDSSLPGYLPSNQDAPSWCYTAGSPCRNITCLNKMFKTCADVRCFEVVDVERLVSPIERHLDALPSRERRP